MVAKWDAKIKFTGTLWSAPTVTKDVKEAVKSAAKFAKSKVEEETPDVTGLMKRSYRVTHGDRAIQIQNSAPYSGFVEYGTSKMTARKPVQKSLPAIVQYFRNDLGRRIEAKSSTKSKSQKAQLDRMPAKIVRPVHVLPRRL